MTHSTAGEQLYQQPWKGAELHFQDRNRKLFKNWLLCWKSCIVELHPLKGPKSELRVVFSLRIRIYKNSFFAISLLLWGFYVSQKLIHVSFTDFLQTVSPMKCWKKINLLLFFFAGSKRNLLLFSRVIYTFFFFLVQCRNRWGMCFCKISSVFNINRIALVSASSFMSLLAQVLIVV